MTSLPTMDKVLYDGMNQRYLTLQRLSNFERNNYPRTIKLLTEHLLKGLKYDMIILFSTMNSPDYKGSVSEKDFLHLSEQILRVESILRDR